MREDGTARCWDYWEEFGQRPPPRGETFATISAGGGHACALREDGAAVCWGRNYQGESSPPSGETFVAISAGGNHTCALRADGTAVCWGDDGWGSASPPSGETFIAISASGGRDHTCALRWDGEARCWGDNRHGQSSPPSGETFIAISAGWYHTCALREDGAAICWGQNDEGETSPPSGETFIAISAGSEHTCALREDGAARCWGRCHFFPSPSDPPLCESDPPVDETFVALSTGTNHSCALRADGTARCWGSYLSQPSGETFRTLETITVTAPTLRATPAPTCAAAPPPRHIFSGALSGSFQIIDPAPVNEADACVKRELGDEWRVADWNDVRDAWEIDPDQWKRAFDDVSVHVTLDGDTERNGRVFFITHFGYRPESFLAHDELGGDELLLGSWFYDALPILAFRPTPTAPGSGRANN